MKRIILPPSLKKGDTIGIVCPAGYMDAAKAATCIRVLQQWGFVVKTGQTLGGPSASYFSGTDEERLLDLQQMLDDDGVQAVLCGRGGYGMGRIIDGINFRKFRKRPKWVIGYSDITIFHNHIVRNFGIAGLHAPMAAAFNDNGYRNRYVQSLRQALSGMKACYRVPGSGYNRAGTATGQLAGGNLSLLVNAIGTRSDMSTKGKILFIEDIGEQKYSIDRMLYQMKRSGKLSQLAGLIFGRFTDLQDTTRPFGEDLKDLLWDKVKEYGYPVCFDFPVSHDKENYALKVGGSYRLAIDKRVVLEEI
ncbi:S66 peptidase family protein [Niabella drilacis]|uniref:Muramoyltetrapeptide carboxypeptidase n=1 Tax=Niabella drilacis (strain DSM 25811 / CCM 8410 / CCUG 62505 / LMG 26954 / E90) TaxID=1285928 RepID=A0A1G6RY61_NIADE|nr:LD-carboxypeptidase [Niabella drilacis]SDD09612.1 muramoyltetrapeptide carboxypeptidase [Niabella drilacis]